MMLRRVAYVVNVFPKLSETFIAAELAELCRRHVEVRVLSLRQPAEKMCHEIVTRARLIERTSYEPREFSATLREFRPEVLHAHFATEPTSMARQLAAELGIRFTFTAHGYDVYRRPPSDFAARAAAAGAVVTVSEANARHITKSFGVPQDCIRVIPCGVNTDQFRSQGDRPELPHVVCVARLNPVKNLGLLLEACAILKTRKVSFRCVVVGDGPCRSELEKTRVQLGLENEVEFVGAAQQSEVLKWWRRATIGVLTSESEGMPVCLMEAAACGVPVVATAVGGIPELVQDGVTGLLTQSGDGLALASALERLLREPEAAARMGTAARRRAEEHFSVRSQIDQLSEVWAGVV
jgi:colanic acid/amylovoran biosynthesis glycosyltransferase